MGVRGRGTGAPWVGRAGTAAGHGAWASDAREEAVRGAAVSDGRSRVRCGRGRGVHGRTGRDADAGWGRGHARMADLSERQNVDVRIYFGALLVVEIIESMLSSEDLVIMQVVIMTKGNIL